MKKLASMVREESQKKNKEVIEREQKEGRVVHLAALMDIFYLKTMDYKQSSKTTKAVSYCVAAL